MKTFIGTIIWRHDIKSAIHIKTSPTNNFYLKKSLKMFPFIDKMLCVGTTFEFHYKKKMLLNLKSKNYIKSVTPVKEKFIIDKLVGFYNTRYEFPELIDTPYELQMSISNERILISETFRDKLKINETYRFAYRKSFGLNLYELVSFELIRDFSNYYFEDL